MVVRRIETELCIIHKMHKICCNTTQNTRNQRVAKLTV